MIVEIGHFALILALVVAVVQGTVPLIGAHRGDAAWMAVARPAALTQAVLVAMAFGALMHAYVTSDFSVLNVINNSIRPSRSSTISPAFWGTTRLGCLVDPRLLGAAVAFSGASAAGTRHPGVSCRP